LAFFGASGESIELYNDIRRWKAEGKRVDRVEKSESLTFAITLWWFSNNNQF